MLASPNPDEPGQSVPAAPMSRLDQGHRPGSATGASSDTTSAVVGPVLEAEIVIDDPSAGPVPVDPPTNSGDERSVSVRLAKRQSVTRRAIVAPWLRSRTEFGSVVRWAVTHLAHTTAFHAVRVPLYAGRLAWRAPAGAARVLVAAGRWVSDAEGAPLRLATVTSGDIDAYLKLVHVRQDRVRLRWRLAALAVVLVALAAVAASLWLPLAGQAVAVLLLIGVLGWVGSPTDAPIISRAVVTTRAQRLTSDIVVRALGALGITLINQALSKGPGISFPAPIQRDGPGWRAEVDLPYGVTAVDIIDKRRELASGLRRPLGCVWPEPVDDEHAGRLVLWVGDQDMSKARQPAWPLAKTGTVDLFQPAPFGTDQRGRWVSLTLMFISAAIGCWAPLILRMVATFIARTDPRKQLRMVTGRSEW
jgi:DNA segregation ATPase FtsK/SpoIIIE, S-DNA-T family